MRGIFSVRASAIEPSWFESDIHATIDLYVAGKNTENSPLASFLRNRAYCGRTHLSCAGVDDYEAAIQARQRAVFSLYESIRQDGYKGSPLLCYWTDTGLLRVYDGHHRLSILRYLGLDCEVPVQDEWAGINADLHSPKDSHGFPLLEKLKLPSGRVRVYQPIDDDRVRHIQVERPDSQDRLDWILPRLATGSVLDIGCSEGFFTRALLRLGRRVVSVDIDKNLIAAARYLTTRENLAGDYRCVPWVQVAGECCPNILYLSVLHNEVNAIGETRAFKALEQLRGKCKRIFIEVPDVKRQPDWAHVFSPQKLIQRLEKCLAMKLADEFHGYRPIYLFEREEAVPGKVQCNGFSLSIPQPEQFITTALGRDRVWEENTAQLILDNLRPGMTFVDVGAHAGYFSILAAREGATVYSFEASRETYSRLVDNLNENGCEAVIHRQIAVSSGSGPALLYHKPDSGANSIVNPGGDSECVTTAQLDDLVPGYPDIVKIDVEGAERMVLEGMPRILNSPKQLLVIYEYWHDKTGIEDWLCQEYGFRRILKSHQDGTIALVKNGNIQPRDEAYRCHLVGNVDTPSVKGGMDAFGTKVAYLGQMLKEMGHRVYFYGVEGSQVPCDEFIPILAQSELAAAYGKNWRSGNRMKRGDALHKKFCDSCAKEILKRRGAAAADLLLLSGGLNHKAIVDATRLPLAMEIGIGYIASFAKYRVFESSAWRHWTYGREQREDGRHYDCVIPGFLDPADFTYRKDKDDYFLFLGRVVKRKGIQIAVETCRAVGTKLKVAGTKSPGIDISGTEYYGVANPDEKRELLSRAKALFMPTTYIEPFGQSVIEAAISGTPVITTDFGAFAETVLHGRTGYRCRTLEQFIWAAKNIESIKPQDCRDWGLQFSLEATKPRYKEFFDQLYKLYDGGWYAKGSSGPIHALAFHQA